MVTQMGDVWLRGRLLLVAVLIGMLSSISINGFMTLAAQAEAPDTENSFTTGFERTAVYRERAASDVRYVTDESVTQLQFVARDSSGEETPVGLLDANPSAAEGSKTWRLAQNPVMGSVTLVAQTWVEEAGEWSSDDSSSVTLYKYPTVQVTPYDAPQSGENLEVNGVVQGVPPSDSGLGAELVLQLLRASDSEPVAPEQVITASNVDGALATFPLADIENGEYIVKIIIRSGENMGESSVGVEIQQPGAEPAIPTPPSIILPATPPASIPPLPTLEKDITRRLSTNFATPLPTSRTVTPTQTVRASTRQSDTGDVLGSETRATLEEVIDLDSTASATALPVEATPQGWRVLGVPWYWWLTGTLATAGSGMYLVRRVARQS